MDIITLQTAKSYAKDASRKGLGYIWALGDSITANDYTAPTTAAGAIFRPRSYLMWACLLSQGKLKYGGLAGTGGFTTAQILATHLPTVLAASPRPQFCVVHGGTNDNGTLTRAQTVANLKSIYEQLLNAGITPVATTLLPKQTLLTTSASILTDVSAWIAGYAARRGFPCIDWTAPFVNTANGGWSGYNAGGGTYNFDDTHPNATAAKAMGQAISDALTPGLLTTVPYLPTNNFQNPIAGSTFYPNVNNALLLTDTNADGVPDGGTGGAGTGNTYTLTAMSAGEGLGNWLNVQKTSTGTPSITFNSGTVTAGRRMLVVCKVKASVEAGGGKWHLRVQDGNSADITGLRDMTKDVTLGVWRMEFTVPASPSSTSFRINGFVDTGNGTLSIGQVGLYDLTAIGTDYLS